MSSLFKNVLKELGGAPNPKYDTKDIKDTEDIEEIEDTEDIEDVEDDDDDDVEETEQPKDTKESKDENGSKDSDDSKAKDSSEPDVEKPDDSEEPDASDDPEKPAGSDDPDESLKTDVNIVGATIPPIPEPADKKEGPDMLTDYKEYETLGANIYSYDAGKGMSALLRDWLKKTLRREKDLRMEFLAEDLDDYLKDPNNIELVKAAIKKAANNRPDQVKRLFVNDVTKDGVEYDSWDEAVKAFREKLGAYASRLDEKTVFKQIWRIVNPDGTLGKQVNEDEVKRYVDNYDGDKRALRVRLGLAEPKHAQNNQNQKNQSQKGSAKPDKGKKGTKPNKNSDNSADSTSGASN